MVKQQLNIFPFFRLVRWQNLLMIVLTQYVMRYCIVSPMYVKNGLSLQINNLQFLLLVLSTVFITAAGYVINDYFDRKTDMLNHPDTVIVGKHIKRRLAMALHIVFNIIGVLSGFYLAYITGLSYLALIFIGVSGLLWFYSTTYKRQFLIGNIIVAFLTGMVPLLIILFEMPLLGKNYGHIPDAMGLDANTMIAWFAAFASFAFILTLIREIVKDTEDFEGDQAFGMQTLPIVAGIKWTKAILMALIAVTIVGTAYIYVLHLKNIIAFAYLFIFLIIPLAITFYLIFKASGKRDYHIISTILKLIMLMGILFAFVARYLILNIY